MVLIWRMLFQGWFGMNAGELANTLVFQENLNKLGDTSRKQLEDKVDALKKAGQIDEANRLMAAAGSEKEAQAALSRVDAQTTFNQAVERLQGIVGSFLEGPGKGLVDLLEAASKSSTLIYTTFGLISSLWAGKMLMNLGKLVTQLGMAVGLSSAKAIAEVTAAEALTMGAATIGIVAGLAAVGGLMYSMMSTPPTKSIKDGAIDSNGGIIVSSGKNTIQLDSEDMWIGNKNGVVAGTNLMGNRSNSNQSNTSNQDLINAINNLANRPVVVHSTVQLPNGEVLARSTNETNRKTHYGVQ